MQVCQEKPRFSFANSRICHQTSKHTGALVNVTGVCVGVCGGVGGGGGGGGGGGVESIADTRRVSKQKAEKRESWEIFCKKEIEGRGRWGEEGGDKNSKERGG